MLLVWYRHFFPQQLTDIVADIGRPVRLRFSHSTSHVKQHDLSICMDIQQALQELQNAHGMQGSDDVYRSCISMF